MAADVAILFFQFQFFEYILITINSMITLVMMIPLSLFRYSSDSRRQILQLGNPVYPFGLTRQCHPQLQARYWYTVVEGTDQQLYSVQKHMDCFVNRDPVRQFRLKCQPIKESTGICIIDRLEID